jgi:hypothetical protein
MNDFSSHITVPGAAERIRHALYEIGISVEPDSFTEDHVAISCLFSELYVDSLFVCEIVLATPRLEEPSLLIATHLMAEEGTLGKDQPLFLADNTGVTS